MISAILAGVIGRAARERFSFLDVFNRSVKSMLIDEEKIKQQKRTLRIMPKIVLIVEVCVIILEPKVDKRVIGSSR